MLSTILIIILILILVGAPSWPYSRGWGYGPSGVVGPILVIRLFFCCWKNLALSESGRAGPLAHSTTLPKI
jgi:hypothetical protein